MIENKQEIKRAKQDLEIIELKLASNLKSLAAEMLKVSKDMKLLLGETGRHGVELERAAGVAYKWAEVCHKGLK